MGYQETSQKRGATGPSGVSAEAGDPSSIRRHVESARLFEGVRELLIDHHGEVYHLRVTRNDKLILTK